MLALAGHNQFHGSIDNYGATYTDAGFGTSVPANASANVKGAATQLIAGASVTEDCYGIIISACGGSVAVATNSFLADLLIDPAGGTSWSTLIANVLMLNPSFIRGPGGAGWREVANQAEPPGDRQGRLCRGVLWRGYLDQQRPRLP